MANDGEDDKMQIKEVDELLAEIETELKAEDGKHVR